MPFDSEGRFTRLHNWEEDRENGISIMSDRADEEDNNFANGLSETLVKDGRAAMTGNLKMGGFQIKNMANGTSESDAIVLSQLNEVRDNLTQEIESQSTKTNDEFVKLKNAETFTETGKDNIVNFCTPDFSAFISKDVNKVHQAETAGFVCCYAYVKWDGSAKLQVSKNNTTWTDAYTVHAQYYDNDQVGGGGNVIVGKGDYYRFTGAGLQWLKFCPMKGAK
jgi:hypothetical protein